MDAWKDINSSYVSLPINHIDTDMIIPAQYLTSIIKTGYGEGLFKRLKEENPDFPLNWIAPMERNILIAGLNFGCGSSREHAVWALQEYGFKVVIAESFADIFRANALKNGLLPIVLPREKLQLLNDKKDENIELEISLEKEEVLLAEGLFSSFSIEPFRKYCLLHGIDDLDYILEHEGEILKYRDSKKSENFFSSRDVLVKK